jgi:hypothetical protein
VVEVPCIPILAVVELGSYRSMAARPMLSTTFSFELAIRWQSVVLPMLLLPTTIIPVSAFMLVSFSSPS